MKKNKCEVCLIGLIYMPYETDVYYESYLVSQGIGSPDEVFNFCPYCRS